MFTFREIWRTLFSCNTCFEIRPFTLLPTSFKQERKEMIKKSSEEKLQYRVIKVLRNFTEKTGSISY